MSTKIIKITSVVAHIDHGKTTLIDSLIASQGFISKSLAGELRYLDSREDEQLRGITLKLSPIRLKNNHVFIDTPGHVDFESLILSSSILVDNHLFLIDVNEGITPRTYSIIKFLNKKRTILVLNKIDKCYDQNSIDLIIQQINGLFGSEVFEWSKNNIIIATSILSAGINYNLFKLSKKNTIQSVIKAFNLLEDKFEKNEIEDIMNKYKIKFKSKKLIFNAIFPLSTAIFDSIDSLYKDNNESLDEFSELCPKINEITLNGISKQDDMIKDTFSFVTPYYEVFSQHIPDVLAISVFGIFKRKGLFSKENVLFVTRILKGTLRKGQQIYCNSGGANKAVIIEKIHQFSIENFIEIEEIESPALICIEGDFSKNSIISSEIVNWRIYTELTPFFCSKLILDDINQMHKLKETIKTISFTEQCMKAKINKFAEIEMKCGGKVQFEKIVYDLKQAGFIFNIKDMDKEFREFVTEIKAIYHIADNLKCQIVIGPSKQFQKDIICAPNAISYESENENRFNHENFNDISQLEIEDKKQEVILEKESNNIFHIVSSKGIHIVESVLEIFFSSGPLIKEKIINTFIKIVILEQNDNNIYNQLKNSIIGLYLESNPQITPRSLKCSFSILKEYLGIVYQLLQKSEYEMAGEEYNEKTDFYVINCFIPTFFIAEVSKEFRTRTKGTGYMEISQTEEKYIQEDYSKYIYEIRKTKGLFVNEKINELLQKPKLSKK